MNRPTGRRRACLALPVIAVSLVAVGCTPLGTWVRNGLKVGPNFERPPAATAEHWIEAGDPRLTPTAPDPAWWGVFKDPVLNGLVATAANENLDLKAAGARVLQAQAKRNIAAGNLFPQSQQLSGAYAHAQLGPNGNLLNQLVGMPGTASGAANGPTYINLWANGFNASWELDFWGRYRRAIESAKAEVGASVEGAHDALVILTAEVVANYVQVRTFQARIAFAHKNVEAQRGALRIAAARLQEGRATGLDVAQAEANVAQTEATIPPLAVGLRQANDRLCALMGRPAANLVPELFDGPIPAAPPEVAVGIPAELLERRPDVRRARREAAAQSANIGVAEADFYPSVGVTGFIGYAATDIRRLFDPNSFAGLIVPNFQWKVLNYGRIQNNVRYADARFRELVFAYQQTALTAGREVEDALIGFLQYQVQAQALERSVRAEEKSVQLVLDQYREGRADFNRVYTTQSQLAAQQDQLAAARGNTALSLIAVYRALGGGWQAFDPAMSCDPALAAGAPAPGPMWLHPAVRYSGPTYLIPEPPRPAPLPPPRMEEP